MKYLRLFAVVTVVLALGSAVFAQDQEKPGVVPMSSSKFITLPVAPACLTLSPQHGDPMKGAAVILMKATAGCKIPWHWHTANENLMFVSGKGKVEMKDAGAAQTVGAGDYVYMPSKHVHEFTCTAACTFFNSIDGAFDIHYVDKDGKEISPEEALKASGKPAMKGGKKGGKK